MVRAKRGAPTSYARGRRPRPLAIARDAAVSDGSVLRPRLRSLCPHPRALSAAGTPMRSCRARVLGLAGQLDLGQAGVIGLRQVSGAQDSPSGCQPPSNTAPSSWPIRWYRSSNSANGSLRAGACESSPTTPLAPGALQRLPGALHRARVAPRLLRDQPVAAAGSRAGAGDCTGIARAAHQALAEQFGQGCADVVVTTDLDSQIVTGGPAQGSRSARTEALPNSQAPPNPGVCPRGDCTKKPTAADGRVLAPRRDCRTRRGTGTRSRGVSLAPSRT